MIDYTDLPMILQDAIQISEKHLRDQEGPLNQITQANHAKVLNAFQTERVSTYHLMGSTGYGLGDSGREVLDRVVARILGTEAALVRGQFASGTHAIATAMFGILRQGDHLLSVTGHPYDTLEEVIGIRGQGQGSLAEFGVEYSMIPLNSDGGIQIDLLPYSIKPNTKMIFVQRSRGYAWRNSISISQIEELVDAVKQLNPDIIVFVDNCYGELVETKEPGDAKADLMAGSLIKNLGGSIAPTGGYIAGRSDLVELAAHRLTAPGIGGEVGPTWAWQRLFFQGIFFSPLTVMEALKGAIFTSAFWQSLGFKVHPEPYSSRTDIIQAIELGTKEKMIAFSQGLHAGSPIDSHVLPIPAGMPGYDDEVIMAGGTFIQGATSEFSADGPLRPPFIVYQQGGISYLYVKMANIMAATALWQKRLL